MEIDLETATKPRSISFNLPNFLSNKLVPLDLKKLRQERLINKTSTPRIDKRERAETMCLINSIEEELKSQKSCAKIKVDEHKLVFNKDFRPKSAIRGADDEEKLVKLAETTANLFFGGRTKLQVVVEDKKEQHSKSEKITQMKSAATQRILTSKLVKSVNVHKFKLQKGKN